MSRPRSERRGRITAGELRDVGRAQIALLRALARVRTRAVGDLVSASAAPAGHAGQAPSPAARAARRLLLQRLELAMARAARRGLFRPTCLVRSLALADLLARSGVSGAEIRIGVRQSLADMADEPAAGVPLEAHAWVELDGMVLGDHPRQARRFTPLGGVRSVGPPGGRGR